MMRPDGTRPYPTPLILNACISARIDDFLSLCFEWGKWSRGGGVMGWGKAPDVEPWTIDDESALCMDAALADLGRDWPNYVDLLHMHFKRGLGYGEIAEALAKTFERKRRIRGLGRYVPGMVISNRSCAVSVNWLNVRQTLGAREVESMLSMGVKLWFERLRDASLNPAPKWI